MGYVWEASRSTSEKGQEVECDAMANPIVHALVVIVAIIIPGGLLAYFAWIANKRRRLKKEASPTVEEAQTAFRKMFPEESLRAKNRRQRLKRGQSYRRRKSQE